jgi:hypothetical protein
MKDLEVTSFAKVRFYGAVRYKFSILYSATVDRTYRPTQPWPDFALAKHRITSNEVVGG